MTTKGHSASRFYGTNTERTAYDTNALQLGSMWIETDTDTIWMWDGAEWLWIEETIGCRAYRDAVQSIPDTTWTAISFDTELYDVGGCFTATSSQMLPTVAGYYTFSGGYELASSDIARRISIRKNGTDYLAMNDVGSQTAINIATTMVYMNGTTDYVEIMVYQDSGGALNIGGGGAVANQYMGYGACILVKRN